MFPDDPTLIARGKYSTLGKERRKQLERIQVTCATLMNLCHSAMKGAQMDQPDVSVIQQMRACVDNLESAGARVVDLSGQMSDLKEEAWG